VAAQYLGGFHINEGVKSLLLVALGFTLLHLLIKPILSKLLGSINFLTLGLVGLLIDGAILYALTMYLPQVSVSAWSFPGTVIEGFVVPAIDLNIWMSTVVTAFVINVVRQGLNALA